MTAAAWLNVSLRSRMPPSTERSASRLCGGVRSPRSAAARSARSARVSRSGEVRSEGTESAIDREPGSARVAESLPAARTHEGRGEDRPGNTTRCLALSGQTPRWWRVDDSGVVATTLVGLDDEHLHLRGDVAVQPHRDRVLAERADRLGQLDLALVDFEAEAGEALGDVGRRDRPVERVLLADAAGDDAFRLAQARRDRFGDAAVLRLALGGALLLGRDLALVAGRDLQRELARQQVVAGEPVGHLDHVAAAAEVIDRFLEDDFDHDAGS